MSNDLLFSILPREGKVPIVHDEQKVHKVSKESAIRELSDQEQELHLEEREARQQQQSLYHKQTKPKEPEATPESQSEPTEQDEQNKGFKHLDIYV